MNFLEILGKNQIKGSKPWITKYKPQILQEMNGNPKVIESIDYYLQNQNIPNMILTGPNGVGKQTMISCLLKEYLNEYRKDASLIVHGSITRGKDVVSEKLEQKKSDKSYLGPNIMNFAKKKLSLPTNLCKIIVIYDFDHMTREAQMALRRVIEQYSTKIRFIFTCNNISNIIEALQSRCVILKFSRLTDPEIKKVLSNIAEQEAVEVDESVLDLICLAACGDLKQAINYFQILNFSEKNDVNSFYKIFNMPPLDAIQRFIISCLQEKSNDAYQIIITLLDNGYNASDILDILFKVVAFSQFKGKSDVAGLKKGILDNTLKISFLKVINQCFYLVEQTGSTTHMYHLISQLIMIVKNPKKINSKSNII